MPRCVRTLLVLVPAVLAPLVFGVSASSSAVALQDAKLSCNDGTNLDLALDATALTALTDATSAINLNPAGDPALSCSLSQAGPLAPGDGNRNTHYAVGGGRATIVACEGDAALIPLESNFALNARVDRTMNGVAGTGTFNVTVPEGEAAVCPNDRGGHLNGKIDCVLVGGNGPGSAQATFRVTHATGGFADSEFEGAELVVDVFDSDLPGGTGDMLRMRGAAAPCDFGIYEPTRPVDHGNIHVHQAS